MAHMHPTGLQRGPVRNSEADSQLGLEQDTVPEGDAVGSVEIVRGTGVNRDPKAGADENAITELG